MVFNAATVNGTVNSESLYLGAQYAEILDFLCSPAASRANVKVLVSEPGLGKTAMLRAAIEQSKAEARTAFVFWTLFKAKDFITHLLFEMGSSGPAPSNLSAAQRQFENLLRRAAAQGRRFVLAIDEAHHLSPASLQRLAALLDRDTASPPQMTVLLGGLHSLHDVLAAPEARGIRERIAGVKTIEPLNAEETAEYIGARMMSLGVGPVSREQLCHIASSSGGVLRTIDKLCHELLLQTGCCERRGNEAPGDRPLNEDFISGEAHIARIAAWVTEHPGTWSGTVAELAAATFVSPDGISDAVENRLQDLRKAGIAAAVHRSPGKPRMITLSRIEREQAPESQVAAPELHEHDAGPQPQERPQEPGNQPALDHARPSEVWLYPPIEKPGAAKRRLTWALKAAVVVAVFLGIAAGLRYIRSSNSAGQASSGSQRVSEPQRSPEADQGTGLQSRAGTRDAKSQTASAQRYSEGNGVPRDDKAAIAVYEKAATQGDPVAQQHWGVALASGSGGVKVDPVAAYAWLVMARNGGQAVDQAMLDSLTRRLTPDEILDVRYKLGLMYEHGIGCVPDVVSADEWFLLGAAAGDARSRAESATLEQRMSPGQISKAHARSDDWLQRHAIKAVSNAAPR
jgi:type II secretory pathway predicted ATPase ExeA/TPR repeat protein